MDPISQGALGAVASQVAPGREKLRAVAFLGCIAGMAPDLDVFIDSSSDPLLFLEYHRQFTHALVFIPVGAALVALPLHPLVRRTLKPRQTYMACLLGYATHGLLDACTSYGTQLLWPFSDVRVAWNNVSIVDPLFTLPLLCLVILAAVAHRRALAVAGLIWAIGYLLLGVVQHQRAEAAGVRLAAERGHQPHRLSAKAGFANLLVWKVVYEHDGRFHVDGIRAGPTTTVCPGASIARLDARRDFPWLDPDSRQAHDLERFRRFSDGYVAVDPRKPNRIVDMRYSMVPNTIDPLWGIELDPEAPPDRHVRYLEVRESRPEQRDLYWRLLTGEDCRALDSMRADAEALSWLPPSAPHSEPHGALQHAHTTDRRSSSSSSPASSGEGGFRTRGSTQAASHDDGADSMKTISVRELQKHIKEVVDSAQHDRVVVTRHGEPAAVLLGVEGKDWETVVLETSPAFWDLIEARRKEPTLSADELELRIAKPT